MAKPAWSSTDPSSGSGNGTVNVSAISHTGRSNRSGTLTFKATGVSDAPVGVTQTAKPEFVTIEDISAPKAGGNITITGTSNSAKLNFTLGSGDITITLPTSYLAGGVTTSNNVNIAGDPGAAAEYNFSITITVPENATTGTKTRIVTVTGTGGQSASATITQSAGDPTLSVSPTSITLDWEGTPVAVSVTSNTNWTVE